MARSIPLNTRSFPAPEHSRQAAPLADLLRGVLNTFVERGWAEVLTFPRLRLVMRRALHIDQWHVTVILALLLIVGQWGWAQSHSSQGGPDASPYVATPSHLSRPLRQARPALRATAMTVRPEPSWVVVARTGGQGLYVRPQPHRAAVVAAWPDGTLLRVMGPRQTRDGHSWLLIRDPAGHTGWVAAEFVIRAAPPRAH